LRTILQERDANPNVILPKQGVAPLHLAIGIESEDFAEKVTRLFLQYGGNPNVRYVFSWVYIFVYGLLYNVSSDCIN
jgi:hypothetical protein